MEIFSTKQKTIIPLNKNNHTVWKMRMQCFLEDLKLWQEPTKEELAKDPLKEGCPVDTRQAWREILCRVDDDHVEYIQDKTT